MRHRSRFLSLLCACVLFAGIVPAQAGAALDLVHDKNWGEFGTAAGQLDSPVGVGVDKWGNVYTAGGEGTNRRVQKFTADGTYMQKSLGTAAGDATLDAPLDVFCDRWGLVYIAEKNTALLNGGRILKYSSDLQYPLGAFMGTGATDNMNDPRRVAVSSTGDIFVTDTAGGTGLIMRFDSAGAFIEEWGFSGSPRGLAIDVKDRLYASTFDDGQANANVVRIMDTDGGLIKQWDGSASGVPFEAPEGVSVDPAGNVYVADTAHSRVQAYNPATTPPTLLDTVGGTYGAGAAQFSLPYDVAVADRNVYVADIFNNRISKWKVNGVPATTANVQGSSRYATAVEASKKAFPTGAEYVIVATGASWPDALGGAALAGSLGGPLLLTDPNALPGVVAAEITRLQPAQIIVLGGTSAVSSGVFAQLDNLAPTDRLWGQNRYETANKIASAVTDSEGADYDGTCFVVTGHDFPDALSASPIAAANHWPILLSETTYVPASVKATMAAKGMNHGYLIGGTGVLTPAVEADLDKTFQEFTRKGGSNRYDTSAKMADWAFNGMGMLWSRPAIATGENFPDALAGGVLQGSDYSPLLLTRSASLSPEAAAALTRNKNRIYELRFLGGDKAVSTAARNSAKALLP